MTFLEKPDIGRPIFKMFPELAADVVARRCPICKKIVNTGESFNKDYAPEELSSPFKDELSRKEYSISGLCADCQDQIFG